MAHDLVITDVPTVCQGCWFLSACRLFNKGDGQCQAPSQAFHLVFCGDLHLCLFVSDSEVDLSDEYTDLDVEKNASAGCPVRVEDLKIL